MKLPAGVVDGPQIRELIKDEGFTAQMSAREKRAWTSFRVEFQTFLASTEALITKNKSRSYLKAIDPLEPGCLSNCISDFLSSHLDYFPDNCGDYSKEQGERFHHDLRHMEERYQGYWDVSMLADYCWCLKRDLPNSTHKRKSLKRHFLSS